MRSSLLLSVLVAGIAACGSNEGSSAAGANGGTIVIALPAEGGDFFPPLVADNVGKLVQDLVFDRLAEIDNSMRTTGDKTFTPRLAQKWTWAPDSLSIAFSIDPRARWHDGVPVTAADVRYSFKVFMDPKVGSSAAPTMQNLDSVSVRDSLTAVVWFKRHTPEQFYDVAFQLVIVPEHVYGRIPVESLRTSDVVRTPIGSGRFRFVKWEAGNRLELVADTANYRGRAKLDRVLIVRTDQPAAAAQVLTGQVDFVEAFPVDQVPKLDSSAVAHPLTVAQLGYGFMGMNQHAPKSKTAPHPVFSDIRVRRALSMAVDRAAMLRNVFGAAGRLSRGPFPMEAPFADSTLRLPAYDTSAAKAMLDSAGWVVAAGGMRAKNGRPLRFSLLVPNSSLPRMRYAVLLQEQLRKIGAQVDLDQLDFPSFVPRYLGGDFDATMGGFVTDPSPSGSTQNWGTIGIGPTGQNVMNYTNPRVDALLDSAIASFDPAKMKSYSSRAFQQIVDDVPAIWLYDAVIVDAVNRRFTTAPLRSDAWWANLADWSIPPDKRIDRDRIGLSTAKP